jgi:hypothetical protein
MQALLTRWMSRGPSLFGGRGGAAAVVLPHALPHAVARREGGRPSRLAPVIRRQDAGPVSACALPVSRTHDGVSLRVDPSDQRRTRISGRMGDVCDALDALIRQQQHPA